MLGENLKLLRQKKNYTQQQIADLLKINRVTYTQYELDKREPDNETLLQLATFFGVTTDYLLGRRDITKNDNNPEIAELLKDNGIEKARLVKEVTLEELKMGLEIVKTIRKQKTGN